MDELAMQTAPLQEETMAKLIEDLGIGDLPQEKQNEIIIKMTEVLLKKIFIETMENLGEDGIDEYGKLMEKEASAEEVEVFLKERISNYDEMVQKVIEEFRNDMMQTAK